ncbi:MULTISPECIES: class F sortase [Streptomyces]|nr:class F sortase [Streptomyces sp. TYQ1024]
MLRTTRATLTALVTWLGSRPVAAAVLVTAGLFSGCWLIDSGSRAAAPPPQPSRAEAFPAGGTGALAPHRRDPLIRPLPPVTPVRVRIPEIKVDAPLRGLRLLPDGSLASPPRDDKNLAGWYESGTAPGAIGTAVVAGHVDTSTGPAVFYNLGALKKKDLVEIVRADGRTAVFTIDAIEVYDRGDFPSRKVYGASGRAELRVITCGGGFSEERHAYLGNVVVYAHLAKVVEAGSGSGGGSSPSSAPPSPERSSSPVSSSSPSLSSSPPREVGPPAKRTGPSRAPAPAPARSAAPKAGGRGAAAGMSPSPAAPAKSRTSGRR